MVYKLMKERFVFKVKLGLDRLEQFVTDGITVNGQRAFFSQHRHMDTVYKVHYLISYVLIFIAVVFICELYYQGCQFGVKELTIEL